jgi:hypothetical protein
MDAQIERIRELYFEEARLDRKAVLPSDLPRSYEAITPEWLTAILCSDVPNARVSRFSLDRANDGFTNRRRIYVEYNDVGKRALLPASVFCKACHDLASRVYCGISGAGENEVNFYNHLRDRLDIEAPRALFARCDPESKNYIIVMRDLLDAEFFQIDTEIDLPRASRMMAVLSKFHGTFYDPAELALAERYFGKFSELWSSTMPLGMEGRSKNGFASAEQVIPPRLFANADKIWGATQASIKRHDDVPRTLTHADGHLKNWYLTSGDKLGLHDWQSPSTGHWSRDVAYAICTSLSVENRRLWERELLETYIDELHAAGGPKVAFNIAWRDYRQQIFSCLAIWTFTLIPAPAEPEFHADATKLEFVRRLSHAIDDLDSLNAF